MPGQKSAEKRTRESLVVSSAGGPACPQICMRGGVVPGLSHIGGESSLLDRRGERYRSHRNGRWRGLTPYAYLRIQIQRMVSIKRDNDPQRTTGGSCPFHCHPLVIRQGTRSPRTSRAFLPSK